ncbi:hypothetical protein LLH06_07810 [Mucilaginibacter daejeonensis]|uniref:hypothetical protein n=1 Tax=Mucilaginibacter daejeonensis TaxID=398049 RepID=UPI001D17CB08|nr:hypothetical protein [Mucilaginibacter daejeonensis]UEG54868.1 hypothetical protein LLH06_07810 [Mucilaginibacter daejeonensis]
MGELKKIAYNCKKATLLIEKKQIESLTLREKLELKIHLAGCSVCRIFEKQSVMINQMVKDLFKESAQRDIKLADDYKKELQQKIEEKLSK